MKCSVDKEDFVVAQKAIKKISPDTTSVYLKTNKEEGTLSLISRGIYYINYIISADVEEEGVISLNRSLFDMLVFLRGKKLKMESINNSLQITCGSKVKLFCDEINEEEFAQPSIKNNKKVILDSKAVGIFKQLINMVYFESLAQSYEVPARVESNSTGFHIRIADYVHCAFYSYKKQISDKDFCFTTYLKNLKDVVSLLSEKSKLLIDDSLMLLKSANIVTTLPFVQDSETKEIDSALGFIDPSNYRKGKITFDHEKLMTSLNSISVISEGVDLLRVDIDKKVILSLKTSFGVSKDKISPINNSFTSIKLDLPLPMLNGALSSSRLGEEVIFTLSTEGNYYKLYSEKDNFFCNCVAPVGGIK